MLSGSGKLAVGNNKEVWSRIDEEEQVMATDNGSWPKRSRRIFERLQEEANGCLLGKWWLQNEEGRMGGRVVKKVRGMDCFCGSVRKIRKSDFGKEIIFGSMSG
jgi:hypothetical protein